MPICGWPCCAASPSVSASARTAHATTNETFRELDDISIDYRLRDEIFELALNLTIRCLDHQHTDQLFVRVDEEMRSLRACPTERPVRQHRPANGVIGDDAHAEA